MNYSLIHYQSKERLQSIEVFILLLGIFSSFYVNVIGQLYISEIILILLFPFLWIRNRGVLLQERLTGRILLFGFLWFISQALTDLIRATPTSDMLRGWAGIIVLLISFGSLYMLVDQKIRRIQFFILGFAMGSLIATPLQPHPYFADEPWKFGFATPLVFLLLLFISYTCGGNIQCLKKWVMPILFWGGLTIYLNARALGTVTILMALVLWLRTRKTGELLLTRLSVRNIIVGGLIFGLAFWGVSNIYGYAAQAGYLGEKARWKYTQQSSGQWGLIIGGRSEILVSTRAVADSPWIGHGSWAKNPVYRLYMYQLLIDLGYYEQSEEAIKRFIGSSDIIPTHSHLFQAWVWAGILGAVFWIVILGVLIQAFIASNRFPNPLYIFVVFITVAAVWDIFFSPFGSVMRMRWATQLVILLTAISKSSQIHQKMARNSGVVVVK